MQSWGSQHQPYNTRHTTMPTKAE